MVSIIIPVYNEQESLPLLLSDLLELKESSEWEVIVVDDSCDNETSEAIKKFNDLLDLKIIKRNGRLGLSSAILTGFQQARGNLLICMDGDGSHPVSSIPLLIQELKSSPFVIASRYVLGGKVDPEWSWFRRIISRFFCRICRPLAKVNDSMSGFFGIRKDQYEKVSSRLRPLSYKIGLELIVKGQFSQVKEVPFQFNPRLKGKSKVTLGVVAGIIYHLFLLWRYKICKV